MEWIVYGEKEADVFKVVLKRILSWRGIGLEKYGKGIVWGEGYR